MCHTRSWISNGISIIRCVIWMEHDDDVANEHFHHALIFCVFRLLRSYDCTHFAGWQRKAYRSIRRFRVTTKKCLYLFLSSFLRTAINLVRKTIRKDLRGEFKFALFLLRRNFYAEKKYRNRNCTRSCTCESANHRGIAIEILNHKTEKKTRSSVEVNCVEKNRPLLRWTLSVDPLF